MKKIVFTGPESTGKTTLTSLVADHFNVPYVKEVAREYIAQLNRPYNYEDLLNISMLQLAEEEKIKSLTPALIICDTDLATIKIWCEDKFQKCESWLTAAYLANLPDIYFLCRPDFPWQHDEQREDPHRREHLYELYRSFLIHHRIRFIEVGGSIQERLSSVIHTLHQTENFY
jgi:nicotinamide riboside kinase